MKKLFEISKTALWFSLFIGLAWLIAYLFQITIIGGIKIGDIFLWLIGSYIFGLMILSSIILVGEIYIELKRKSEDAKWNIDIDSDWGKFIFAAINILVGSIVFLLLDFV